MDVSTIQDITQLKAMAYDQLQQKDLIERNLQVINTRIAQLQQEESQKAAEAIGQAFAVDPKKKA